MSKPETKLASRRTLVYALYGGIIHLSIAGFLWFYLGIRTEVDLVLPYLVSGAVLLGVIPAVLLATKRLVTPSLVVAGALVFSAYWSMAIPHYHGLPPVSRSGLPSLLFHYYLLGWVIVSIVALIVGTGEYGLRHVRKTQ